MKCQKSDHPLSTKISPFIQFLINTGVQWALRREWLYYASAAWNNSSVWQIRNICKILPVLRWSFLLSPHHFPFFLSPYFPLSLCLCQCLNSSAECAFGWLNIYKVVGPVENKHADVPSPTSLSLLPLFPFHLLHLGCSVRAALRERRECFSSTDL